MVAKTRVLIVVLLLCACHSKRASEKPMKPTSPVDLVLPVLDGGEIALSEFRGRVVVVQFLTTWSVAGQLDFEEMRRARSAGGEDDVKLMSVALDADGYELVAPWRDAAGLDWYVLLPTAELTAGSTPFGVVQAVPTTYLLDREGRIVWRKQGGLVPGELVKLVKSLVQTAP